MVRAWRDASRCGLLKSRLTTWAFTGHVDGYQMHGESPHGRAIEAGRKIDAHRKISGFGIDRWLMTLLSWRQF